LAALSPAPHRLPFVLPCHLTVLPMGERVNGFSVDLRNPAILQAMTSLAHEVERPRPMGRVYADSLVIVILTELVRRATAALPAQPQTEALPPRLVRRIVESIDVRTTPAVYRRDRT
jgi:hypothetical protein